jgi:uncharacterized protein
LTLCDTGPLVALIDADDSGHRACVAALARLPAEPLVTTWPCFTEAMHMLRRAGGERAQEALWEYLADGLLILHQPADSEWTRIRALMKQFHDAPMDLADASLVAAAEALRLGRVFTLDRHFYAYRLNGTRPFEVIP